MDTKKLLTSLLVLPLGMSMLLTGCSQKDGDKMMDDGDKMMEDDSKMMNDDSKMMEDSKMEDTEAAY